MKYMRIPGIPKWRDFHLQWESDQFILWLGNRQYHINGTGRVKFWDDNMTIAAADKPDCLKFYHKSDYSLWKCFIKHNINWTYNILIANFVYTFYLYYLCHKSNSINFSLSTFQNIITLMGRSMNSRTIYTIVH